MIIRTAVALSMLICASPAWAKPKHATQTGVASWYGAHWAGRKTASGERFNPHHLTAASRSLPMGTRLLVSYGRRHVTVKINDRGPYIRGRVLDLSEAAASRLGIKNSGTAKVKMRVLG